MNYKKWKKTADIANKYGKDGAISALKEAIDNLLSQEIKTAYTRRKHYTGRICQSILRS